MRVSRFLSLEELLVATQLRPPDGVAWRGINAQPCFFSRVFRLPPQVLDLENRPVWTPDIQRFLDLPC